MFGKKLNGIFSRYSSLNPFVTEYYHNIDAYLLARNFLNKLLLDSFELGFNHLRDDINHSVTANVIFNSELIKPLNEIILDSLNKKHAQFLVVTNKNYNSLFQESSINPLLETGQEKVIGYTHSTNKEISDLNKKYLIKINIENIFPVIYTIFLFNLKYQTLGNIEASVNIANKPLVKVDIKNLAPYQVESELQERLNKMKAWMYDEQLDNLAYMSSNDSIELLMPNIDQQELLIERINKEISQITGLSLTYIEGKVVGGLGDNAGDKMQNEKVFKRIAKTFFIPIFNYIQLNILGLESSHNTVILKPNQVAIETIKDKADSLVALDSLEVLTEDEKRFIVTKILEDVLEKNIHS